MTADQMFVTPGAVLTAVPDARAVVAATALTPSAVGPVGLELESHLVDLRHVARRIGWTEIGQLVGNLPAMPARSRVTVEPGGQLELSTTPQPDVVGAVEALRRDHRRLRDALREAGFGIASIGADPARPVHRVNPASRYISMEKHFDALAYGGPGRAMMSATAALQVNLNAGPPERWAERIAHIHRLGPVLGALSACSPLVAGRSSGWRSMRQQIWSELDRARCGPLHAADPADGWARYAMAAPVMLVREPGGRTTTPVTDRVTFADWVRGQTGLPRPPTVDDLDYHLSTLFPPVRLRGYLEIRCLDAVPLRWWPALAALTVTLIDDDVAADLAGDACAGVEDSWTVAARDGLADPTLWRAASRCVEIAAARCPDALRPEVERYAELAVGGRTPGDALRERAAECGPLSVLEEVTDA